MAIFPAPSLDIAALKRAHSLALVVSAAGVPLRPAGTGRYRARCPFHDDHTPSLLVDERDGHFFCFGCQARGDVIDFLMRHDGLDFRQALERLSGMPLPTKAPPEQSPTSGKRYWDRLVLEQQVLMNTAAAIYQHTLWHTPNALEYLRARGLPDWLIRAAGLGYADGHSLETYLRRHGGLRIVQALGLLTTRGQERLAGRVVVPELRGGQYIWFIGRSIDAADDRPKYLALEGERPLLGQERVAGRRTAFLCEGAFDFLTAVSWRLPACSPCGTHFPPERLGVLARATTVYGVLDGDVAGRAAAERFGAVFGARWQPLWLPDGCDLNDLARQPNGRAEFFQLLAATRQARSEGVTDAEK
ncbi:MAG TPA: DNA primase [Chloroflexota bacterium]